ncbi:MAG: ACT domain-containing protein [Gammaproteobacteria bacterium]|nr:ACT domain-containing protein [Gammaproteobacteria bacterium]MDX5374707.1 ACT domain-containing protein [Gammaproteobacteria bacterium]
MSEWNMVTVVGEDRPGIVAALTARLFEAGAHLGEASMMRLGSSFTIMLMVQGGAGPQGLTDLLAPLAGEMGLRIHVDPIEGGLHRHLVPDVRITVHGADRAGIVARVTGALAEAGLNILDLESDVGGSIAHPIYIMVIEGLAREGIGAIEKAVAPLHREGIEVAVQPVDTLVG